AVSRSLSNTGRLSGARGRRPPPPADRTLDRARRCRRGHAPGEPVDVLVRIAVLDAAVPDLLAGAPPLERDRVAPIEDSIRVRVAGHDGNGHRRGAVAGVVVPTL